MIPAFITSLELGSKGLGLNGKRRVRLGAGSRPESDPRDWPEQLEAEPTFVGKMLSGYLRSGDPAFLEALLDHVKVDPEKAFIVEVLDVSRSIAIAATIVPEAQKRSHQELEGLAGQVDLWQFLGSWRLVPANPSGVVDIAEARQFHPRELQKKRSRRGLLESGSAVSDWIRAAAELALLAMKRGVDPAKIAVFIFTDGWNIMPSKLWMPGWQKSSERLAAWLLARLRESGIAHQVCGFVSPERRDLMMQLIEGVGLTDDAVSIDYINPRDSTALSGSLRTSWARRSEVIRRTADGSKLEGEDSIEQEPEDDGPAQEPDAPNDDD